MAPAISAKNRYFSDSRHRPKWPKSDEKSNIDCRKRRQLVGGGGGGPYCIIQRASHLHNAECAVPRNVRSPSHLHAMKCNAALADNSRLSPVSGIS